MTLSNNDQLANVSTAIDAFLALPVYPLLDTVPADLSLKLFIPSKDNQSVLSGTQEMFRSLDVSFDFVLPDPLPMPDPNDFDDTAKGFKEYKAAIGEFELGGKVYNDQIKSLASKLIQHDITRKFAKLQRVCQFVRSHDSSMFEHDEELDLFDLPESTRSKILQVYKNAFNASPNLLMTGSTVNLLTIDPLCSLDSIDGIDRIIAIKNQNQSASYAFMGRDIMNQALKTVKNELNMPSLSKAMSRLDSHFGGSKNATTIIANLRMLHGFKPTKGKKTTA